jgi:phospholipase/lecithinase/hemolysin
MPRAFRGFGEETAMTRQFRRALLGASLLGAAFAAATPAAAQRVDRIVVFGDSYADTGNALRVGGLNPLTFQNGIYSTGRFSGGTNYADTLSQLLSLPQENFAFGGAAAVRGSGSPFDLQLEVDNFLNVGTQLPTLPTGAPSFDSGDLVLVSIGGNDARYFQQGVNNGRTVQDSINAANTQLNRLVAAGAPTISFLAGNTALLPEVATNPAAQAVRQTFSNTYNTALQGTLAGYAAQGVTVHYLDLSQVLANVQANPAAFGVPNGVVCPATQANVTTGCAGYLFYVDNLHLSSDGFRIVGQYINAQLQGPLVLGAPSDLQLDTARQFARTLNGRVDAGAPRNGETAEGVRFFVVGDGFSRDVRATVQSKAFDASGLGATAGVELGFGNGVIGVAAGYSRGRINFGDDAAEGKARTLQVGGYAGYAIGPAFVQGHLGYGRTKHDFDRAGVVDPATGDVDGHHLIAGAKAGYLAPLGILRAGPFAQFDYARAKIDG